MNPSAVAIKSISLFILSASALCGALVPGESTSSMKTYVDGTEKLTVYTDVPGHETPMMLGSPSRTIPYPSRAKSDIYEIRVRSAATDNEWVQCFANMTYNRAAEMPELADFQTATAIHGYQRRTAGWTHTYANIEMSDNTPVEVEIRKIGDTLLDGSSTIVKSAVYPPHKLVPSSKKDENGRVYFKINKPGQIVIDINGQMDDHNAAYPTYEPNGRMPDQPDGKEAPVHSIAFYANPIMTKPVASPTNRILTIEPTQSSRTERLIQPDLGDYDTVVFSPGVHNIGTGFKVQAGRQYYIPGDAILYGSITNEGTVVSSDDWNIRGLRATGDRIKVFGYGSICGMQTPHYQRNGDSEDPVTGEIIPGLPHQLNPEYPEWNSWPEGGGETDRKRKCVGVRIEKSQDMTITGVSVIDPATFNTKIDGNGGVCLVSWVKLHSWRVNGDGFGGYPPLEDSFIRAADDSTYVRNWRRRCTFWKDTNSNLFKFINYISGGLEDCDIIYNRWRDPHGNGRVFSFEGYSVGTQPLVMKFKDLRFHDKLSNPQEVIDLGNTTTTFPGLTFENITFYTSRNGAASELMGNASKPYTGDVMFKNVTFQNPLDGSAPVRLNQGNYQSYFTTNEFVDPSVFEPGFTLTTSATNGHIVRSPPGGSYLPGTVVTVAAYPALGYAIGSWGGDLSGAANTTSITMDGDKSITASFTNTNASTQFTQAGTGTWTVPPGVESATFHLWGGGGAGGSAHNNSTPESWITALGGGGTGGSYSSETLQVTPGQVIHYTIGAGGVGSILNAGESFPPGNYGNDGGASFASLAGGESFVIAQGGYGGNNVSSQLGTPRYASKSSNLGDIKFYGGRGAGTSFTTSGSGGGSAGSLGDGGNSDTNQPPGSAGPGGGAVGGWHTAGTVAGGNGAKPGGGGGGAGVRNNNTPDTFRKGGNGGTGQMIVTYHTSLPSLTTQAVNGTIGTSPSGEYYPLGATTTLTAIPDPGYKFTGWSGDLIGNINPSAVVMDGNKSVVANFTLAPEPLPWIVNFDGLQTGATSQGMPTTWEATRNGTFEVTGDQLMINDVSGEGVFASGEIDISGGSANLSLDVRGVGGLDASGVSLDYIRVYTRVDGGVETLMHQALGPIAPTTWTTNGIAGNTLQIVIRTLVTAASEFYYFDNLQVVSSNAGDPFIAWAGSGVNFDDDANNDGVDNGMAWFLGADHPNAPSAALLPKAIENADALVLEFDCLNAMDRGVSIFEVQYSSDLGQINAWSGTPVPGEVGIFEGGVVDFIVTNPEPPNGLLRVVATIPLGEAVAGKLFGRVKGSK